MITQAELDRIGALRDSEERYAALVGSEGAWKSWRDPYDLVGAASFVNVDKQALVAAALDCAESVMRLVPGGQMAGPKMSLRIARQWPNVSRESLDKAEDAATGYAEKAGAKASLVLQLSPSDPAAIREAGDIKAAESASLYVTDAIRAITSRTRAVFRVWDAIDRASDAVSFSRVGFLLRTSPAFVRSMTEQRGEFADLIRREPDGPLRWEVILDARWRAER